MSSSLETEGTHMKRHASSTGSDENARVAVTLHVPGSPRSSSAENVLDIQILNDTTNGAAGSPNAAADSSAACCPHGRIVYLDTIIIELLGGARIASKPYSAASGHHIMLLQGDRVWKVTRSKRENAFYTAIADGAASVEEDGDAEVTESPDTPTAESAPVSSAQAYSSPDAQRRAAAWLAPFVPHSYGIRKVRRLRVGSYELGEAVALTREDFQRLISAAQVAGDTTSGHDEHTSSSSYPTSPVIAVATFSPVSDHAPSHRSHDTAQVCADDVSGSGSASQRRLSPFAGHSCPLVAPQPHVLQHIVEQFDRDMEDVWLRYYRYVPPAVTASSPPTGVAHDVASPTTKAALVASGVEFAGDDGGVSRGKSGAESCDNSPSAAPLAFSFVLSSTSGPPAAEPHLVMENQLNCQLPASGPPEQSYVEMIVLEDCCHGLQYPCTMDIKMGTRQYGLNATEEKKRSKNKKAKLSTTGEYGIRIDGVRQWNLFSKTCNTRDKKFFRRFNIDQVKEAVFSFLRTDDSTLAEAMREKMLHQCEALCRVFEKQTVYHLYTSSLLFLYDAARPVETCRVVMVDFAYAYRTEELVEAEGEDALPPGGHDESYLTGLRSLIAVLKDEDTRQPPSS